MEAALVEVLSSDRPCGNRGGQRVYTDYLSKRPTGFFTKDIGSGVKK